MATELANRNVAQNTAHCVSPLPRPALKLVDAVEVAALEQLTCFVGVSPNVSALKDFVAVHATQSQPALLIGERGLRQEQIGRALHQAGAHASQPFFAVNAHRLSSDALHGLLFGPRGVVEKMQQGTIYINELTSLPLVLQQRFAACLEEQRWYGHASRRPGPRLVFATEVHPNEIRAENRIAYGLVELLKPSSFTIKPLRERSEDIPYLANHLVENLVQKLRKGRHEISPGTMRLLTEYRWEQNIDELESVLESAVSNSPPRQIDETNLPTRIRYASLRSIPSEGINLPQVVEEYERSLIETALRQGGGSQTRASQLLGLRVQTLNMKLKRLSMRPK